MEFLRLKNTDLNVSRVCFGAMTFGGQTAEADAARILDRCLDAGVNFLDTANVYTKGASETILGRLLKGRRDKVVLASKVRFPTGEGADQSGLSRAAIFRAIDESLRRLATDYLDIYYLHAPDYSVPLEETLATLDDLVKAGKIRYPASSNYAGWQVAQMLSLAERHAWRPAWITQPMYNLLARGIEQEYLPMCRDLGVSTAVYNPLAGGLLTGKHPPEAPLAGSRFDNFQLYLDRYWHPACFEAVEDLRQAAQHAGRSLVSLSLNWLLHHTPIDCVILGASRLEQLEENLKAVQDGPLPQETLAACDAVWSKLRGVTPKYNR
jgi:aryl-alcohol dehydrogenase-like predicted oxidoreductase